MDQRNLIALAVLVIGITNARGLFADEPLAAYLPQVEGLSPEQALGSFTVLPGFHLKQVAAEPLVQDPVAMSSDERGRLYVVEMCDYSEQDRDFLGKVRLLEDADGDGRFEQSTLFAERLSWPTAVNCYDGGVFVGAAPDILFLKDTDGDGRADRQEVVFTGFGRQNVQGLLNSFQWGLDNRIYGAASSSPTEVRSPKHPERPAVNCRGRDFSFDPRTLEFRTESGGAQHGLSFDDWGRRFVCSNADHLQQIVYDDRYAARNRRFAMPPARVSIAADGPQAEVFRQSPVEPWRILRTEWRKAGKAKGAVEAGGKASGYFTSATGVTAYRGDAFPAEFRAQVFVADVGSNLIHRKRLEEHGEVLVGKRLDRGQEFVASRDTWFRPVQMANAPDGTLYVCDMCREVIEHPQSIPPEIKAHLDLTSGRDRGRIYRVVPARYQQRAVPRLDKATSAELVQTLEHRNGWHRDTAARLLFERQDSSIAKQLGNLAQHSALPEARLQALYVLQGLGALSEETLLAALSDAHPRVREQAVRLAESCLAASAKLRHRLGELIGDADVRLRFQLALSLGELPERERVEPLAQLALANPDDAWIAAAVQNSIGQAAGQLLVAVAEEVLAKPTPAGTKLVEQLAEQAAQVGQTADLAAIERLLSAAETKAPVLAKAIVAGLARSHLADGSSAKPALWSPTMDQILARLLQHAIQTAGDASSSLTDRVAAIHLLSLAKFEQVQPLLTALMAEKQSLSVQLAAVNALAEFTSPEVATLLIDTWPEFSPKLRTAAAEVLLSRRRWTLSLLEAIDAGKIPATELDRERLALLSKHPDKTIRRRGAKIMTQLQLGKRDDVVQEYQRAMQSLTGQAERGREVFRQHCAACHRLEEVGHEVGPPLAAFKNRGVEAIVLNVLDPNREVLPQYQQWLFLVDGVQHVGMIRAQGEASLMLVRGENATETLLQADIEHQQNTGRSLMPEGFEKQISPQQMADLVAYILSQK